MSIKLVIGTLAKPGGGKGTFTRLLRDVCYEHGHHPSIGGPRFSDALRKAAQMFDILESRENLQKLAQALDALCPGAVANGMGFMLEQDQNEIKIADGVRWLYDEKMINSLGGLLVYVKADPVLRFQRIKDRAENAGDREKTWEKFQEEDMAENEKYVDEIGSRAHFKIDNNGTLENYKNQVREFYRKFIAPCYEKKDE